jgi:Asp-tRNA(Asn)/Glu-tRNA(Gln) amidotransferase A subunit family amidase
MALRTDPAMLDSHAQNPSRYDPRAPGLLSFSTACADFRSGTDTPLRYLERCLERVSTLEPVLRAFASQTIDEARAAAKAATERYARGQPLSVIDGLPVAIKDIFETRDAPTAWGVAAFLARPPWRDAAVVNALRIGGAAILGKTRLPELGLGAPAATVNPWDHQRSPGGSSSGSAAAVGAAMVPVAIGTQGRGSLTRPASYCGAYAFKPSHGAIHRGGDGGGQETNTQVGTLAGSLEDAWIVARYLSDVAGPHPGGFGLEGPATLPPARRPRRLVRLEGPGWQQTDEPAKQAYENLLSALEHVGVEVVQADESPDTQALSRDLKAASQALGDIADYESRWPFVMYLQHAEREGSTIFSPTAFKRGLARADIPRERYHAALRFRQAYQQTLAACQQEGLLFVSPSATGAASADLKSTGSSVYQWASSLAGNPVVSLPFMAVEGLPFGLQVQGFRECDAALIAHCRWLDEAFRSEKI